MRRFLLISSLFVICGLCACYSRSQREVKRLSSNIETDIPIHSTYTDVLAYLDRQHIDHSEYVQAHDNPELLHLLGAPGRIDGVIRNVESGFLYHLSIRLVFRFDAEGKLSSWELLQPITSM
jgi:hypothetical protein